MSAIKMNLLLVACLVAVCSAAPPVPVVAPAFCASGEIYFHDSEDTKFGKFSMYRDYVSQKEMEIGMYEQANLTIESLLRYDSKTSHMAYYIRGPKGNEQCTFESRNVTSKLPPFFDWVKLATYEGQRKIKEINYDLWGLTVADVRFELAVAPGNPNVPVYYNRKETEDFVEYSFMSFNATTPDPKVFDVPPVCKEL